MCTLKFELHASENPNSFQLASSARFTWTFDLESNKSLQAHMSMRKPFTSHASIWSQPLDTDCIVPASAALWTECTVVLTALCCWWWDSRVVIVLLFLITHMLWGGGSIAHPELCWLLLNCVKLGHFLELSFYLRFYSPCSAWAKPLIMLLLCKILKTFHFTFILD